MLSNIFTRQFSGEFTDYGTLWNKNTGNCTVYVVHVEKCPESLLPCPPPKIGGAIWHTERMSHPPGHIHPIPSECCPTHWDKQSHPLGQTVPAVGTRHPHTSHLPFGRDLGRGLRVNLHFSIYTAIYTTQPPDTQYVVKK